MPGTVQSIARAAVLLHAIEESGGAMGVTELATAVGLPKTTAHGLLRTLLAVGFVEQDPRTGRYRLGAGLLGLGSPHLDANELRSRASNWADSLAARSGCAVRLGTPAGLHVVVVHHVFRPDDSPQELDVGAVLPAHATAIGKVLLAARPAMARALTGTALEALTPRTVVDPAALLAELRTARSRGWAEQHGEYRLGTGGIAAAVHRPGGLVVGALGVCGPVEDLVADGGRTALPAMVVEAAAAVSRELAA